MSPTNAENQPAPRPAQATAPGHGITCGQRECSAPATEVWWWPGRKRPMASCAACGRRAVGIGDALGGLYLNRQPIEEHLEQQERRFRTELAKAASEAQAFRPSAGASEEASWRENGPRVSVAQLLLAKAALERILARLVSAEEACLEAACVEDGSMGCGAAALGSYGS